MQKKLDRYQELCVLMAEEGPLNKMESAVVLAHALNLEFGLQCVDRKGNTLQFPVGWRKAEEQVYKFQYRFQQKIIQFRFVNNDDVTLTVNFVCEDGDDLMQDEINLMQDNLENTINSYVKSLERIKRGQGQRQSEHSSQNSVIRGWDQADNGPWVSTQPKNPHFQPELKFVPFKREEYVGPNSDLFIGRGRGVRPGENPGIRYDPVDPFSVPDGHSNIPDFSGFNEWGQPRRGGFNGMGGGFGSFL